LFDLSSLEVLVANEHFRYSGAEDYEDELQEPVEVVASLVNHLHIIVLYLLQILLVLYQTTIGTLSPYRPALLDSPLILII
jgi:hypothetical protein